MYGVPKFKEGFFLKFKKEVLLTTGALLTIATVVNLAPKQTKAFVDEAASSASASIVTEVELPDIGNMLTVNGTDIGVVDFNEDVDGLLGEAYNKLVINLGYDPEVDLIPELSPVKNGELLTDSSFIVDQLLTAYYANLDVIKTKAIVMRIGDDFTVALKDEADVKAVLEAAQMHFIKEDVVLEVDFEANEHNSMVMTPKVLMKESSSEEALSTSGQGEDGSDENQPDSNESLVNEEGVEDTTATEEASEEEAEAEEGAEEEDDTLEGTMVAVEFAEDIALVETYVDPSTIVDVETATELITKENEKEQIYYVKAGDSPSTIADDNGMRLSELYKMNPGLEEQKYIHVDDPVVVKVPEPELKVETIVEVVYTEPIYRRTVYTDDPDSYVGDDSVVSNGSDGTLEVTALITKLNGEEISREVIATKVLVESVDKIVALGSKPFPVKGATGEYSFPVSGYRISSYFGYRWGSFHHGVDLAVASGTPIRAADGGTVIFAGWKSSIYGYFVEIDHGDGVTTRYAHCSSVSAKVGDAVAKGEQIAKVGSTGRSTGPHVHFEIRFDGVATDPLDYLE